MTCTWNVLSNLTNPLMLNVWEVITNVWAIKLSIYSTGNPLTFSVRQNLKENWNHIFSLKKSDIQWYEKGYWVMKEEIVTVKWERSDHGKIEFGVYLLIHRDPVFAHRCRFSCSSYGTKKSDFNTLSTYVQSIIARKNS